MTKLKTRIKAKGVIKLIESEAKKYPLLSDDKEKRFIVESLYGNPSERIAEFLLGTKLSAFNSKLGFIVFEETPIGVGYHMYAGMEQKIHVLNNRGEKIFSSKKRAILPEVYVYNSSALNL